MFVGCVHTLRREGFPTRVHMLGPGRAFGRFVLYLGKLFVNFLCCSMYIGSGYLFSILYPSPHVNLKKERARVGS